MSNNKLSNKIHKVKRKLFKSCISKDETRRNICGLIHHNKELKAKTATNGHVLMLDYSEYCSQLGEINKSLDVSTMQLSNFEYPKIIPIIPSKDKAKEILRVTFKDDAFVKGEKIPSVRIYKDGTYSFKAIEGKDHLVAIQQAFVKELKDIPLVIYYYGEFNALLITFDGEFSRVMDYIVMPMRV